MQQIGSIKLVYEQAIKTNWNNYQIINQKREVFRSNIFENIIKKINNMNNISLQIFDRLKLRLLGLKTYGWKKLDKQLVVFKFNFKNKNQYNNVFEQLFEKSYLQQHITQMNQLFNKLQNSAGLYFPLNNYYGIMFVDPILSNQNIIKHQLIHFIQDVSYQGLIHIIDNYIKKNNYKFTPMEVAAYLDQLNTFNLIDKSNVGDLINQKEIIPYFNSLCYYFEDHNINHKRAIQIIKDIFSFRNTCNNINQLKQYLKNIPELKDLDYVLFLKVLFCLINKQHKTIMLRIVGNYLKELK